MATNNPPSTGASPTDIQRFQSIISRSRDDALAIIATEGNPKRPRLKMIGERLMAVFDEIDATTTLAQRLVLIDAPPEAAANAGIEDDRMISLVWVYNLEGTATRPQTDDDDFKMEDEPLRWAVMFVMLEWMRTDEGQPLVDQALRETFGDAFDRAFGQH